MHCLTPNYDFNFYSCFWYQSNEDHVAPFTESVNLSSSPTKGCECIEPYDIRVRNEGG